MTVLQITPTLIVPVEQGRRWRPEIGALVSDLREGVELRVPMVVVGLGHAMVTVLLSSADGSESRLLARWYDEIAPYAYDDLEQWGYPAQTLGGTNGDVRQLGQAHAGGLSRAA
ncbi:hypothetical protein ACIRPK_26080 [Kitasatospora sp. NPDC101801]|uniref:hypothetical protein n=1 Tax=Kitasatospora sp. NPDC101801 TaxID=3364103 RepID=UPI0038080D15